MNPALFCPTYNRKISTCLLSFFCKLEKKSFTTLQILNHKITFCIYFFNVSPPSTLIISIVQICNYAVMHIFFLFSQNLLTNAVQSVRSQFKITFHHQQHIVWDPALKINGLIHSATNFSLCDRLFYLRPTIFF